MRRNVESLRLDGYYCDIVGLDFDYVSWHLRAGEGQGDDVFHSDGEDVPEEEGCVRVVVWQ